MSVVIFVALPDLAAESLMRLRYKYRAVLDAVPRDWVLHISSKWTPWHDHDFKGIERNSTASSRSSIWINILRHCSWNEANDCYVIKSGMQINDSNEDAWRGRSKLAAFRRLRVSLQSQLYPLQISRARTHRFTGLLVWILLCITLTTWEDSSSNRLKEFIYTRMLSGSSANAIRISKLLICFST